MSGGVPATKCPIESPVVLTTYKMPFLPPAIISDVPGIKSGPELPMSVSALSSAATSDGMNQEPTVGVPENADVGQLDERVRQSARPLCSWSPRARRR